MTQEQILQAVNRAGQMEKPAPQVESHDEADAFFASLEANYGGAHRVEIELPMGEVLTFEVPADVDEIAKVTRGAQSFDKNYKLLPDPVATLASGVSSDFRIAAYHLAGLVVSPKLRLEHFLRMAKGQGMTFLQIWGRVQQGMMRTSLDEAVKDVTEGKDF